MFSIVSIVITALCLINIIVHLLGVYLLCSLIQHGRLAVRQKYLTNLSICELLYNTCEFIKHMMLLTGENEQLVKMRPTYEYLVLIGHTEATIVLYLVMTYITFDRLMCTLLGECYSSYWDCSKVKLLHMVTWVFSSLMTLSFVIAQQYTRMKFAKMIIKFTDPILDILFITLSAVLCFYTLCKKVEKCMHNRRRMNGGGLFEKKKKKRKPEGLISVFVRSGVDVSRPIMITFFVLMVLPNLIQSFLRIVDNHTANILATSFTISYGVMTFIHGLTYLLFHNPTKRLIRRKLKLRPPTCNFDNSFGMHHLLTATAAVTINPINVNSNTESTSQCQGIMQNEGKL